MKVLLGRDQDFKSSNHFFSILVKEKGLYGFSNALLECKKIS